MTTSCGKKAASKKTAIVQAPLAQSSRATLEAAPEGYADWIRDVKARVHEARQRAARAVNSELVGLYWRIGRDIRARQEAQGWGAKIVDRISADLKTEFPDTEGFSPRNLKYMRAFAVAWPDEDFVQGTLAQWPWYTHLALLPANQPEPTSVECYRNTVRERRISLEGLVIENARSEKVL